MKRFFLILFLLCVGGSAWAHHIPTVTDRPDTAEASVTVGKNHLQIETSFGFSHDKAGGVTTRIYSFPTLLRFGLVEWLEFRMEGEMVAVRTETGAATRRGFTDLAFGIKSHLLKNNGCVPSLGLLAHVNTPTGKNSLSANAAEPIFKILADWGLPGDFSLGTNVGFDVPARDTSGRKPARLLYAGSVGIPSPLLAEKLGFFLELSGIVPVDSSQANQHNLDTGFTFKITRGFQIDSFVNIGLNEAATDLTTGLGFSWQLL